MTRVLVSRGSFALAFAAALLLLSSPARSADAPTYTLAVLPQMSPVAMRAVWSPFVDLLSHDTGYRFSLRLYDSMTEFEEDVSQGTPDLVYLHSVQVVGAKLDQGYLPLVRNSRDVSGSFVVRKDSPITSIRDLEGRTVAFVGKKNLCRALLDHELVDRQRVAVQSVFSGSAGNMVKLVTLSKADAGGALDVSLEKLPPDLLDQVRIIYTTEKIAPHALAAHPRLPAKVRAAVLRAVLAMGSDDAYRSIMAGVQIESPVAADYGRDYSRLERELDVYRYFGPASR